MTPLPASRYPLAAAITVVLLSSSVSTATTLTPIEEAARLFVDPATATFKVDVDPYSLNHYRRAINLVAFESNKVVLKLGVIMSHERVVFVSAEGEATLRRGPEDREAIIKYIEKWTGLHFVGAVPARKKGTELRFVGASRDPIDERSAYTTSSGRLSMFGIPK